MKFFIDNQKINTCAQLSNLTSTGGLISLLVSVFISIFFPNWFGVDPTIPILIFSRQGFEITPLIYA